MASFATVRRRATRRGVGRVGKRTMIDNDLPRLARREPEKPVGEARVRFNKTLNTYKLFVYRNKQHRGIALRRS